jgi:hypothetical protein
MNEAKSGTPTQNQDLRKQVQGSQSRKQSEFQETRGGFDVVSQAARSQPQRPVTSQVVTEADRVQMLNTSDPREFHRNMKKRR